MAEGALVKAATDAGIDLHVESAGTAGYHIGEPPDPRAIATARANGVDISAARGQQLAPQHFHEFTHIFALDSANLAGIKAHTPRNAAAHITMLLDAIDGRKGEAVPDPYYGDESDFEACWNMVSEAADALVLRFKTDGANAKF